MCFIISNKRRIYLVSILGKNLLISIILRLKAFMSKIRSYTFKKAIGTIDKRSNFNDDLDNWDRD